MKITSLLTATVLATTALTAYAADKQPVVKAPVMMTDAQMKEVVAGEHVGPGFGICTAVGKAHAPGAINNFGPFARDNTPGNGNLNGKGFAPGFGQVTSGQSSASPCNPIG